MTKAPAVGRSFCFLPQFQVLDLSARCVEVTEPLPRICAVAHTYRLSANATLIRCHQTIFARIAATKEHPRFRILPDDLSTAENRAI
jgi:hypothetical protein